MINYRNLLPVGLLLLAGCARQHVVVHDTSWAYKEFEARHYDVPLLLDFDYAQDLPICSPQGSMATYLTSKSASSVHIFYKEHMERLGWDTLYEINGTHEVLLSFKKPMQFCTVSIRADALHTKIVVSLAPCRR